MNKIPRDRLMMELAIVILVVLFAVNFYEICKVKKEINRINEQSRNVVIVEGGEIGE